MAKKLKLKNFDYSRNTMAKIKFVKTNQEAKFRSPLFDFKLISQLIEIREDPLTGKRCRINFERARRPKQVPLETSEIKELVEHSKAECFFCPENMEKTTPMFPEGFGDRIKMGKACLFPNLFPFGAFHAVGIFSDDHHLELDEFKPRLLRDCFTACIKYFKLVEDSHPELRFWYINWNYMYPAAASIIHPHVQIFSDSSPTLFLNELIEKSREYHKNNGTNYWIDLVETERARGERYIGRRGSSHWMADFAPQGNKEVLAVIENVSSLAHLERKLDDFCAGLSQILKGYCKLGIRSMNFATYAGPSNEDMKDFYWLNARLIARPYPTPFYVSDCGFMERFHLETIVETMPEDLAKGLKKYF
jgi:UDPglucose--hexose-1-phosphate uridylyltransferase